MLTEELLDRVDENDKVIGTTIEEEAHRMGYAHRIAAIFVFDDNDRLLVQHRKKDGLLDHSAAGHICAGESYDEAAARELKEELGLAVPVNKIGMLYTNETTYVSNPTLRILHYFGLYEAKPGKDILKKMILSEEEVSEIIPMTIKEIVKSMADSPKKWTNGFRYTLDFYIKNKNLKISAISIK